MGEPSSEPQGASFPKTILVVEDEILIRMTMVDALVVLESSEPVYLIITDVRVPGLLDGLSLAAHARSRWPAIKIIVVSGHLSKMPTTDIADAFFTKPYQHSKVISCIETLLKDAENHGS